MSVGPWSLSEIQSMTDMALLMHIEQHYSVEARSCANLAKRIKQPAPEQLASLQKDAREYQSLSVAASKRIATLRASHG